MVELKASYDGIIKILGEYDKKVDVLIDARKDLIKAKLSYENESDKIRGNINKIQEELALKKAPTEKQTQSYIDNKLQEKYNNYKTNENIVKSLEIDLNRLTKIIDTLIYLTNIME